MYNWLVVWNMNFMTFHSVGNVIISTDSYFSVGLRPFPEPKLEVPTIFLAYVREYPHKIWPEKWY
jgi:hypothetical protein